jgi:hypothetical protein
MNTRVLSTYCLKAAGSGLVISTWKVLGPSIKVIGAVKSHAGSADAVELHPIRYVVTPFVTYLQVSDM